MLKFVLLVSVISYSFVSCNNDSIQAPVNPTNRLESNKKYEDQKIKKSKAFVEYENKAIDTLIQIKGWEMERSKTGLRWQIEHKTNCKGLFPVKGDYLDLDIEVLDIHEKVIFKKQEQIIHFRKEVIENGLDEALSKMCVGSKAKLILPSHLAFGLRGYKNEIGLNQVLIYNVEFINKK